ncbi:hypothetical protein JCM30237_00450 [Halolamina litorea]|uniref:Uncharacterized protein n=1 Tax=Halolamina litorea TaxID=1515593 RepID=A0ABD6BU99_9EURY|nr:hypothetical protein [Halolamina litorea]
MLESRLFRFVSIAVATIVVAFPLAAVASPPDPYTQVVVAGTLLMFLLPVAYLLSHPTVYAWMQGEYGE